MTVFSENTAKKRIVTCFMFMLPLMAMGQQPVMQWDFENIEGRNCIEASTQIADTIEGNFEQPEGVKGKGLRLDGFTTRVMRDGSDLSDPGNEFTIEGWVSLGEYPWNWCPLITTESNWVKGYRLMIGPHGQVSLEVAVGEQWVSCTSADKTIPLRKWMHLTGVYAAGKYLKLYVNGEQAATLKITGSMSWPTRTSCILGMVTEPGKPSDIIRTWGTVAAFYGLQGIIDEVKVYNQVIPEDQILKQYQSYSVKTPDIPVHRLPTVKNPGRFGAYYTKLKYYPSWDNLWPVDQDPDIVVCFDKSPVKVIFWRGTRYGPVWVSENENWMGDQSVETWNVGAKDTEGCFEHMQDRHCRFSHVRIIENNDARVVIHWRYAPVSSHDNTWMPDPKTGWEAWADEYYYIYPDGTGIRRVSWNKGTLGPRVQFQESLPILQPGQKQEDMLDKDYVNVADYEGHQRSVSIELRERPPDWPRNLTIQQFNFKSENKPFICFEPGNRMSVRWIKMGYNHYPVGQARCDGRWAAMQDRPSHIVSSPISGPVIHDDGTRKHWCGLYGMNNMSMDELVDFGRSWSYPANLSVKGEGFVSDGYDNSQRCYKITNTASSSRQVELTLQGSNDSPVINPAIVIENWNSDKATVQVEGDKKASYRIGINHELSGDKLVIFVFMHQTKPVKLTVSP